MEFPPVEAKQNPSAQQPRSRAPELQAEGMAPMEDSYKVVPPPLT